ncbi:MAG: TlpA disulfide reductase family protein, partial [Bacteroidota bacterium]
MKKVLSIIILIVAGLLAYKFFLKPPTFDAGESAPVISGTLIDGSEFSLEDLRGSYVLLDFWGSWCGPCRREFPMLKSLYADYHGKAFKNADNFHIVSIALEKSDAQTKKIISSQQLDWPHHIIDVNPIIMISRYAQQYDVKDLPTKFLINPDGKFMGTNLTEQELRRILDTRL